MRGDGLNGRGGGGAPTAELETRDSVRNVARAIGVARAGWLVGLAVLLPAVLGPLLTRQGDRPSATEIWGTLAFAASGLGGAVLAARLWNWTFLRGRTRAELRGGNIAAGLVAGAHHAGAGIVAGHCFAADALHHLPVGAAFFLVSELTLVGLSLLFRRLTDYADDEEVRGQNMAAAVSYASLVLSLSWIVGQAADGSFLGWIPALLSFGLFLGWALLLYPVRQVVVSRLLGYRPCWRSGALDEAVGRQRDVAAACVEGAGYLATALLASQWV